MFDVSAAIDRAIARRSRPNAELQLPAFTPLDAQREFLEADGFVKGFCAGIGSGKSVALCVEALRCAYDNPGRELMMTGPTYSQLADSTLPNMFDLLEQNGIRYRELKSRSKIKLTDCGSSIFFRSLDDPNRIRGLNLAGLFCDELSYCKRASFEVALGRVRVGEKRRRAASFTPSGRDWTWKLFASPEKSPDYVLVHARPYGNTHLPADYYDRLKSTYSVDFFRQECLGEFITVSSNAAYTSFDRNIHVQPVEYASWNPLFLSLDFNYTPAMTAVICQEGVPADNWLRATRSIPTLNVVDEVWVEKSSTAACLDAAYQKIIELNRGNGRRELEVRVYGDASSNQHRSNTGSTDQDVIRAWADKMRGQVRVMLDFPSKNPYQRQRVNSVNGMLKPMEGDPRLFVHPRCEQLINDLEQVTWDKNGDLSKDDPMLSHISDALGYVVHRRYGHMGPLSDTRKPIPGMP